MEQQMMPSVPIFRRCLTTAPEVRWLTTLSTRLRKLPKVLTGGWHAGCGSSTRHGATRPCDQSLRLRTVIGLKSFPAFDIHVHSGYLRRLIELSKQLFRTK